MPCRHPWQLLEDRLDVVDELLSLRVNLVAVLQLREDSTFWLEVLLLN